MKTNKQAKDIITTPERKILVVLCYYFLMVLLSLVVLTIVARSSSQFKEQLFAYFACEAGGHDPENPCDVESFRQHRQPEITVVVLLLVPILPSVHLIYAINAKELLEKGRNVCSWVNN